MGAFATHGSAGRLREAKLVSSDVRSRLTESAGKSWRRMLSEKGETSCMARQLGQVSAWS